MYTRATGRRRVVASALLIRIEEEARDAGKPMLRLETGAEQGAAIALYERSGFRRCAAFGHYAVLEPHRIAASLFHEKLL